MRYYGIRSGINNPTGWALTKNDKKSFISK